MDAKDLKRVAVIGTSCSGKTTFAINLAHSLGNNHIEMDALNWLPQWTARPPDEFRSLVKEAVSKDEWVVDGYYSRVRDAVWSRATCVIWLNYSFPVVMYRALRRTLRRSWYRETLFSGNRESLRMTFLSRDSLLPWILKTYRRRRREYPRMLREIGYAKVVVLKSPENADRFLAEIRSQMSHTL